MKVTRITDMNEFAALAREWDALLRVSDNDTLFLSWRWMDAFLKHMGTGQRLYVLLARDDHGTLKGIVPLVLRRGREIRKKVYLELLGQRLSFYGGVIADPECRHEVYRAVADCIFEYPRMWDILHFCHMAEDPRFTEILKEQGRAAGYRWEEIIDDPCKVISLPASYDLYLSSLPTSLAKKLNYYRRALHRDHTAELCLARDDETLRDFWGVFFRLHIQCMQGKGRTTILARKDLQSFYSSVAAYAQQEGLLRLYALKLDGAVVAVLFGIAWNDAFYFINIGYKEYAKFSLGLVLPVMCLEQSILQGMRTFDFLGGGGAYKEQLGAVDRGGADITAAKPMTFLEINLKRAIKRGIRRLIYWHRKSR